MICVGIDVASFKHDVCIMSTEGTIFGKKFQIKNSRDEYEKLLSKINQAKKFFNDSSVCIGIESTGVYSSTIINYFYKFTDFKVIFINPVLTNMYQHSQKVHYAKTDSIDAEGICNYLIDNGTKLLAYTQSSYHSLQLKSLYRKIVKLNKDISKAKNELTGLIHAIFPEFLQVFPKIRGNTVYYLLKEYSTPNAYKGKHAETIFKLIHKKRNGRVKIESIQKLISLAKESIGVYNSSDKMLIRQLAESLLLFENQKKELNDEIADLVKRYNPRLLTMPGVGTNTAAGIIGEIGNIHRFKNADALLAYAGLNPLVYQSGNYEAKNTKISKKGSPYLRNALTMVARIIYMHDETFAKYYEKKRNEGKSYNTAISHVRKKVVRVIYTLLKSDKEYRSQEEKQI